MRVLQADGVDGVLSRPTQPSVTLRVKVEGGPWVVKLICGDIDESRWGRGNEPAAQRAHRSSPRYACWVHQ